MGWIDKMENWISRMESGMDQAEEFMASDEAKVDPDKPFQTWQAIRLIAGDLVFVGGAAYLYSFVFSDWWIAIATWLIGGVLFLGGVAMIFSASSRTK